METYSVVVETSGRGVRLDAFLSAQSGLTRSRIQKAFEQGQVLLNGAPPAKLGIKLQEGDRLELAMPGPEPIEAVATQMDIPIVYEDAHLAVINKPRGLVVHPAAGHQEDTLVNGLLFCLQDLSGIGGALRPGIVHRLDKDTTGLLVVAKNDEAHISLSAQIKERSAGREYLALAEGRFKEITGVIEAPIGRSNRDRKKMAVVADGRYAKTNYTLLEEFEKTSLLRLKLDTGRTHQIRVHLRSVNHPVCGDALYGYEKSGAGKCPLMLHATALSFVHPKSGEEMRFEVEPPQDFLRVVERQRRMQG